jgi:hypothetical protein
VSRSFPPWLFQETAIGRHCLSGADLADATGPKDLRDTHAIDPASPGPGPGAGVVRVPEITCSACVLLALLMPLP